MAQVISRFVGDLLEESKHMKAGKMVLDLAIERIITLEALITDLRWNEFNGCITGNCPHKSSAECVEHLRVFHEEIGNRVKAESNRISPP